VLSLIKLAGRQQLIYQNDLKKKKKKGPILYKIGSAFIFIFANFCHLVTKTNPVHLIQRIFVEKMTKVKEFRGKISKIAISRQ
jgi:hypothetical protein